MAIQPIVCAPVLSIEVISLIDRLLPIAALGSAGWVVYRSVSLRNKRSFLRYITFYAFFSAVAMLLAPSLPQASFISIPIHLAVIISNTYLLLRISKKKETNTASILDLEKEIAFRIDVEDKIIAKHKQLEWAEKTARICYGSWDVRKDRITFSDGAQQLFNLPPNRSHSFTSITDKVAKEDRQSLADLKERILNQGPIKGFVFRYGTEDALKFIQVIGERFEDPDSGKLLFRGTFQDVTEQQLFIKKIEEKNAALQEIANVQSHDVRGPVATILGLVAVLKEQQATTDVTQLDEETKNILTWIGEAADQLDQIIKDIVQKSNESEGVL